jgi:hypothetical protein
MKRIRAETAGAIKRVRRAAQGKVDAGQEEREITAGAGKAPFGQEQKTEPEMQ